MKIQKWEFLTSLNSFQEIKQMKFQKEKRKWGVSNATFYIKNK